MTESLGERSDQDEGYGWRMDASASRGLWRPFLTPEGLLACLLLGIELTTAFRTHLWAEACLGVLLCGAAAIGRVHPRTSASTTMIGVLTVSLMARSQTGPVLYAPLVALLGLVAGRHLRLACVVTVACITTSVGLTLRWAVGFTDISIAIVVWIALYAIPWLVGAAVLREKKSLTDGLLHELDKQREHIIGDLHDGLAHDLVDIVMTSEKARLQGNASPEDLDVIADSASRAHDELRGILGLLRTGTDGTTVSLASVWQDGIRQLTQRGFPLDVTLEGSLDALRPSDSDALGRASREAFNNMLHHGDASHPCHLSAIITPRSASLEFVNQMAHAARPWRLGLQGIADRITALGGGVSANQDGGEWRLRVTLRL